MRRFLAVCAVAALAMFGWSMLRPPFESEYGEDTPFRFNVPSAHELGASALDADYIVEKSDVDCVGEVLYESHLSNRMLRFIVRGGLRNGSDLIFPVSEGSRESFDFNNIQEEMVDRCGVHPWPKVDRWPSDMDRMY